MHAKPSKFRGLQAGLTVAVALSFVAMLVPTASAQGGTGSFPPSLTLDTPVISPNAPIQPDLGRAQITIDWTYTFRQAFTELSGVTTTSTTLVWQQPTCTNTNVIITGSLAQTIVIRSGAAAPETSIPGSSTFNVEVTQQAPGETPIRCDFRAQVEPVLGTQIPESNEAPASINVYGAYLGLISVNVPSTIKQAGPQKQIRYELEITNLGNAQSNLQFALANEPSGGWNPIPPTQQVLQSAQQGGTETSKTIYFLVSTPFKNGWNNKDTTFQLTITPTSTKNPDDTGQPVSVNVLARVRGVYVPSLEPMLMLGALMGAALVVRLARRDE